MAGRTAELPQAAVVQLEGGIADDPAAIARLRYLAAVEITGLDQQARHLALLQPQRQRQARRAGADDMNARSKT